MIKLKSLIIRESLDNPYKFKCTFETELIDYEDSETGETYKKDVLKPVQIIEFKTDNNIPYVWYARQSRYDGRWWEITFGIKKGTNIRGGIDLDIGISKTGDAFRIFATVIDIINSFIEFDNENFEVQHLILTSKGNNRTNLYVNRLIPKIENVKVKDIRIIDDNETEIILDRIF